MDMVVKRQMFSFQKDVFMYYGLTNYYQNHRRYVKSRDDAQLLGDIKKEPSGDCAPFDKNESSYIAPCGAIANSLFNGETTHILLWHSSL